MTKPPSPRSWWKPRRIGAALGAGAVVLAGTACSPVLDGTPIRQALEDSPCAEAVLGRLRKLAVTGDVLLAPPLQGQRQLRLPTHTVGTWVTLSLDPNGLAQWELRSRGTPEHRILGVDEDCQITALPPRPARVDWPTPGFTDHDLRALTDSLAAEGRGLVVYAWSPHMPLSVDGWAAIENASQAAGVPVIPVLINGSDGDFARREAERVGMPAAGLAEVASLELIMRDIQVHAPSILIFDGSRISRVLPGYRDTAGYLDFLSAFLGGEDRPPREDPPRP